MTRPTQPGGLPPSPARSGAATVAAARARPRAPEQRLRHLLDGITDGFVILDRHWRIRYINGPAEAMLQTPPAGPARPGQDWWQTFPALRATVFETSCRAALERRESSGFELHYLPRQCWLDVRAYVTADGLACHLHDITERKAEERRLRESANRLQVALAAGKLGDWRWDAAGDCVTLGQRAAAMADLPADTSVNWMALSARLLPDDRQPVWHALLRAAVRRSDFNIECRLRRPDGSVRWLSLSGHPDVDDQGALRGMTGMAQDISARQAAADLLRQSEEDLRALANAIPQLAWIAAVDGAVVWYNERWYAYTGTTSESMLNGDWQRVYDPACLPQMKARWEASLRSGTPFEMEFPIRGADGQFRWFLTRANPVRGRDGQLRRWFGTSTDVDQVKRAQEALREETDVLELLNRSGSALASQRELGPLLQEVTDAATRICGARHGAFLYHVDGETLTVHSLAGAACAPPPGFPPPTQDGPLEGCVRLDQLPRQLAPRPSGPALCSYLAMPVRSRSGTVIGSLHLGHPEAARFSERSERMVASIAAQAAVAIDNARLIQGAQRAAAERAVLLERERCARAEAERTSQIKDEFLATLSHELRTPLSAILGWAQVLQRGSRDQDDVLRGLHTIERNARLQAQLIEDLLDMSRIISGKVQLEMYTVSPLTIVDAALDTVRPAAEAKHIGLLREADPAPGMVVADPGRLQQIVWNLLSNALKFTPRGGTVRVAVHGGQEQLTITVSDNGIGIRPEFLAHVFERFRQGDASTTRRHGGLGLGLSIVKYLVEQHGGTVSAASPGEGGGASFSVRLPLASNPFASARPGRTYAAPAPPQQQVVPGDLAGLQVLVVDDEADARELIRRILSDCKAEVLTAASAAEALALLQRERPDLLVSDIGLPGMDGFELLERVRALGAARGGDLPAIALTAFARSEDRRRALDSGFRAHLAKPVDAAELVAAVAAVAPGVAPEHG